MRRLIVELELAPDVESTPMDRGALRRLLVELDAHPVALYCPDRALVQLRLEAADHAGALRSALSRWNRARTSMHLASWNVVRAELFTPEQLERDLEEDEEDEVYGSESDLTVLDLDLSESDEEELVRGLFDGIFGDPVTGLGGDESFRRRLAQALDRASRSSRMHAVVSLDLDDFGALNRRLGFTAADQVLVATAGRLAASVRPADGLARLGGDRFALLLEDSSSEEAVGVVQRVLDALRAPVLVAGQEVRITASAGIALTGPGQSADQVLDNADRAMTDAKAAGRNTYRFFGPGTSHSNRPRLRLKPAEEHDRLSYLLLMQQAAVAANDAATLEGAVRVVLKQVCRHTGWSLGHLCLVDDRAGDGRRVVPTSVWHVDGLPDRYERFRKVSEEISFAEGQGLPGRVLTEAAPICITDVDREDRRCRLMHAVAAGFKTAFGFPVLVGTEVVAVLEFFADSCSRPNPSLLEVMATVGTQLGRVVERQRAQEAAVRSEQRFRLLTESAVDAIITMNARGDVVSWNPAAERMFGYREAEIVGQPVARVVPERYRRAHERGLRRFFARKDGHTISRLVEWRGLRADGSEFPIELALSSYMTNDGPVCTAIIRDITDRREAQRAFRVAGTVAGALSAGRGLKAGMRRISALLRPAPAQQ